MPLQTPAVKLACPITIDAFSLVERGDLNPSTRLLPTSATYSVSCSRSTTIPLGFTSRCSKAKLRFGKTVS